LNWGWDLAMHCCSYFCRDPTNKNKTRQRTLNCTWPPHRIKLAIHQDYALKRIMGMLHQQSEKAEKNHTEKKHTLLEGLIEIQYHHSNNLAILDSQDLCKAPCRKAIFSLLSSIR
jgi:hypothetical protein